MGYLATLFHHQMLFLTSIGFCSFLIGGILNSLIYRYPFILKNIWHKECKNFLARHNTERNSYPFCSRCKTKLCYFFLTSKCTNCQNHILTRFPYIEMLTAALTIFITIHFGVTKNTLMIAIFTWGLIILSIIDINEQLLPDAIIYFLLWLGLLASIFHYFINSTQAIFGAIAGYIMLWTVAKSFRLIRKKEGMGHGDFKMLAMIGAWVGINNLLNVLFMSVILALFFYIPLMIVKRISKESAIPFGPFLAIGGWFTLVFGPIFLLG